MMKKVLKISFEWESDGKVEEFSYHANWNGLGGMLFSKQGSTIATIDVADVEGEKNDKTLASDTGDWLVMNWDGSRKVEGEARYEHPVIGRFHRSTVGDGDTLAQVALAMQTFTKLGWTRRRKSGTGQFEGEYA